MSSFHWEQDFSSRPEAIFALTSFILCSLISLLVLIHFGYQKYRNEHFGKIPIVLRSFAFVCILSNSLYTLGTLILQSITLFENYFNCVQFVWPVMFIASGRLGLYYYFLARIHYVFYKSVYEVSVRKLKLIAIVMAITVVISLLVFYINVIGEDCVDHSYILGGALATAQDTFWCTATFVWILVKLRRFMHTSASNAKFQDDNDPHHSSIKELMILIAKLRVLSFFALLTSWINISLFLVVDPSIPTVLDTLANTLCLMLSFAFNNGIYQRLCLPCDLCCRPSLKSLEEIQQRNKAQRSAPPIIIVTSDSTKSP